MINFFINLLQKATEYTVYLLNELIFRPAKAIFIISSQYMAKADFNLLSYIGFFIIFFCIAWISKTAFFIMKSLIQYAIYLHREKKRAQILEVRRREKKRTEARIKANREFDEMFEKYGNADIGKN